METKSIGWESSRTMVVIRTQRFGLNRQRHRAAFSLIEMTVVIGLSSVVLGLIVSYIIAVKSWDRAMRDRSRQSAQLLTLAEVLRTDIRGGRDVRVSSEETLVVTSLDGDQSQYVLGDEGCVRTVVDHNGASGTREQYAVGRGEAWKIARDETGHRPLVAISLETKAEERKEKDQRPSPLLVYAALGAERATVVEPLHATPDNSINR